MDWAHSFFLHCCSNLSAVDWANNTRIFLQQSEQDLESSRMTFCVPCAPEAQIEGCPASWAVLCSLLNFERERVVEEMPGGSQESEWFMSAGMLGEHNSTLKSEGPALSSDLLLRQITKWVRRRRGEPHFKTNHFLCIPTWCVYHDMQAWCYFGRKKR